LDTDGISAETVFGIHRLAEAASKHWFVFDCLFIALCLVLVLLLFIGVHLTMLEQAVSKGHSVCLSVCLSVSPSVVLVIYACTVQGVKILFTPYHEAYFYSLDVKFCSLTLNVLLLKKGTPHRKQKFDQ